MVACWRRRSVAASRMPARTPGAVLLHMVACVTGSCIISTTRMRDDGLHLHRLSGAAQRKHGVINTLLLCCHVET